MPGVAWRQILDVALVAREVLEDYGLTAWPKTSGSRGFHIYARIAPSWSFRQVRLAAQTVAREVERRAPERPPAAGGKKNARGCSSTSTRTPKTAPSRRHIRCGPPRTRGSRAAAMGRGRRLRSRRVHRGHRARTGSPTSATRGREWMTPPASLDRLLTLAEELGPAGEGAQGCAPRAERAGVSQRCRSSRSPAPKPRTRRWPRWTPGATAIPRRRSLAAGRRPGRRHARTEFDLVPDPDQPAARARQPAAAAGGADRRLQPLADRPLKTELERTR